MEIKDSFNKVRNILQCLNDKDVNVQELIVSVGRLEENVYTTIHGYKSKIGGYSKANKNYASEVERLKEDLLKTKNDLKDALNLPNDVHEKLREEVNEMYKKNTLLNTKIKALQETCKTLEEGKNAFEEELKHYKSLPWYRRIFAN